MKKLIIMLCFIPFLGFGQKPFINSISPTQAEVGQTVTITGSNLNNVNLVFFGGMSVAPSSTSANAVTAVVPAGATHGSITLQTTDNNTVSSGQQFLLSFSGSDITNYDAEYLVSTGLTDVYDICMCDLDGDDLNDLAMAHNAGSGAEVTVYLNNTTGTGSFTGTDFQVTQTIDEAFNNTGALAISCGDFNHDGAPDLVFSSNGVTSTGDVFVYRNNGAGNMIAEENLKLPAGTIGNRGARKVRIIDIDDDGNLDILVGNGTDGTFHVFRGNGNFNFNSADEVTANGTLNTSSIIAADFNNDGKPDVGSLPFRESNEIISIFRNTSGPGAISFDQELGINVAARRINIETADFDNDGFIDIVTTNQQLQRATVYRNTTTSNGGSITFAAGIIVPVTDGGAWGVDIGDMNGDGLPDLIIGSTSTADDLFIIENTSISGSISFASATAIPTTNTNQNVVVGDLNGDARPDIAFTHNIQLGSNGNLGIFLNRNCVEPVISPDNLEFCFDDTFSLTTTKTQGATYNWQFTTAVNAGSSITPTGDNSEADIVVTAGSTTPVGIRVTITHDNGETFECAVNDTELFDLISGSQPTAPTINDPGAVCVGDAFTLSAAGGPFDEYEWTLPDGSTVTTDEITVSNASISDAGSYSLRTRNTGQCFSEESNDFILEVGQPPILEIVNNDLDDFCTGTNVTLQVPDFTGDGFTYQWQRNGSDLTGENGATLSTSQQGNYTVEVTDANTCLTETATYTISAIDAPTSNANGPTDTCVDFLTSFTSSSTGEAGFTLEYEWVVNDGSSDIQTATTQDFDFTFPAAGNYTVTLNTSYPNTEVYAGGGASVCEDSDVINVTVADAPTITFDQTDLTAKCQADILVVGLTSPDASTISTYQWSIRDAATNALIRTGSSDTLQVATPIGIDTVWAVVNVSTTIGCDVRDSIRIRNFPSDLDISSSDFNSILNLDSALLEDATSIRLTAENAVSDVSWEPAENFSNATGDNTIFFPQNPTSTVILTAMDNNGCTVSTQVIIALDNIRPKRTFSPNGDGMNDCWEILNIGDLGEAAGCEVYVFDSRGRNITTKDQFQQGDNCVWDGNFNSSPVPEGVYYYVMKCEDDNFSKSGSILLAR